MSSRRSGPAPGTFSVHWVLSDLPTSTRAYDKKLSRAWLSQPFPMAGAQTTSYVANLLIVVFHIAADDLGAAIDRGCQALFGLIDEAGLHLPGSVCLVAGAPRT